MEFSRPWRACRRGPPTLRDATPADGLGPWGRLQRSLAGPPAGGHGPSLPRGRRPRGLQTTMATDAELAGGRVGQDDVRARGLRLSNEARERALAG